MNLKVHVSNYINSNTSLKSSEFSAYVRESYYVLSDSEVIQLFWDFSYPDLVHLESFPPRICDIRYIFQVRLRFFYFGQYYQLSDVAQRKFYPTDPCVSWLRPVVQISMRGMC